MQMASVARLVSQPAGGSVTVASAPTVLSAVASVPQTYGSVVVGGSNTPRQAMSMGSIVAPTTAVASSVRTPVQQMLQQQAMVAYTGPTAQQSMQQVIDQVNGQVSQLPVLEGTPAPAPSSGLPDPRQIETQRGQYMKSLDDQLKEGADVLNQQLKQQQDYLLRMGDQQKRQFGLQVDQHIKHQELELVQQHNHQLLMLQQAAQQQKVALEQQANSLLIEYNQKKANEDLTAQMYQFETAAADAHRKYQEEIKALQHHQAVGAQQLAQQGEALARQASISNMQAVAAQQVASRTSASLTHPMPGPGAIGMPGSMMTPPGSYLPPVHPGSMAPPLTQFALPRTASRSGPPTLVAGTGMATPTSATGMLTPRTAMAIGPYGR